MIRESRIDRVLNRLQAHFGSHVIIRPPASAAELAQLEALVGPMPRELMIFLITCNGLRVEVQDTKREQHLWHIEEILSCLLTAADPSIPEGFLPIRGDVTGQRDWLALSVNKAHESVVRWDPWSPQPEIVASSFGAYVEAWTQYLTEQFQPNGTPAGGPAAAFDAKFVARTDETLRTLRSDSAIAAWLKGLEHPVSCGEGVE